ncbi:MAG TPA: mechanosensitive ion channel family protein, partial [Candidatus Pacearchaeota archaeon]|nr:mechanosensitive ion channel family protein [Candidatus Pacearchaeota archaeon]
MIDFEEIISYIIGSNTPKEVLVAIGLFIGLFIGFKIIDTIGLNILQKASRKTKIIWDDIIIDFIKGIKWPFFVFIALYISAKTLALSDIIEKILGYLMIIFIVFYATKGIIQIVDHLVKKEIKKRTEKQKREDTSMVKVMGVIVKVIIWTLALLMILSNFGIEITPLIAGIGVGGIAIALALQTILGDLFSAFAIYLDKPFQEGDFIILGNDMGVVKHIGIKTTRIQTLQGQELVVSNSELTSSRINNYKRMQKRRIVFGFGIEYNTPVRKMEKIKSIVKKIIDKEKLAELDRVHFKEFGDFSLNYEVVYYLKTSDYNKYMDTQESINLSLKEAFEKEKIGFAF